MHKAIACLWLLLALLPDSGLADIAPLKVGVILPLSGKGASVGVSIKNGMLMAQERLPAEKRAALILKFEDDSAESRQTVSAAQRLINEDKVDALITAFSNSGNAVVPITERAAMPLLSLAYDRGISNGKSAAFTFWVDIDALAAAAAGEAARRGYRKVAVVSTLHEGNLAMREKFMRAGAGTLQFTALEEVALADTDLNSHVLRLKAGEKSDAVALLMHGAHLGLFVRSLRANGIGLPLFTLGNFEDQNVRVTAGPDLKGQWYSTSQYSPWFLPEYRKQYPRDSTFGAAYGHDAVLLLTEAAEKGVGRTGLPGFFRNTNVRNGAFPEVSPDGKNGFSFPVAIKAVGEDGIE